MNQTLPAIDELLRLPAPCPAPMGLACDGPSLWITSFETGRLYGLNAQQGTVFEEAEGPGPLLGTAVLGDTLRVVAADGEDNRKICRYIMGRHFKESDAIRCPDDTGSFLAYDGDQLFLSQRYNKRILELDESGKVLREIGVPREITGMVVVEGRFYLMTTESKDVEDYRVLRVDARKGQPQTVEVASVPFRARSIAWDGSRFWTNARFDNTIVAFALPQ